MKNLRILFALGLILVVVVVAQVGVGAWSNRLQPDPKAVAPAPEGAGARPQGTVGGSPTVPIGPEECTLIATYCVTSPQTGLQARAITELPDGLTPPEGAVLTRMIEISGEESPTTKEVYFTLTPPLGTGEKVAYWDGTQWVELTFEDGKYTIPAGVTLPLYLVVFTG